MSLSSNLLSLTTFLPLVGAVIIAFLNQEATGNARWIALWTTLVTFAVSLLIWTGFDKTNPGFQFVEEAAWLGATIRYKMGVDGISMLFVILTTFLMPLVILSSWGSVEDRVKEYMIAFLLLETLMIGVFCALDLLLFYLFFEAGLIPMFIIIGVWGGKRRVYASFKFFLYTLLGSVLMLLAMMAMYWQAGTTDIPTLMTQKFPREMQWWLFLAFFASFAVKMPMWPVHTWLPDAHVEAPTGGSVILAAILLKMGGYGFLRFSLPMFPLASLEFQPFIFTLSIVAIVYTSLVALAQEDVKKLIAYSSVAHMGYVTMGIFTFNQQGIDGAIFQMLSHGLVSAALFLCVGVVYDRMHTREIAAYGGLVNRMPIYAFVFMVFTMANVGLPGTSGFRRRVPDATRRLQGQHMGRLLRDLRRHPVGGLCTLAVPSHDLRRHGQARARWHQGHELARDRGPRAVGGTDHLLRYLSRPRLRCDGSIREEARDAIRTGHQDRASGALRTFDAMPQFLSSLWPIFPELLLVGSAMALLMLGVFRPDNDTESEMIGWLAIASLVAVAYAVWQLPTTSAALFERSFLADNFARFHENSGAVRLRRRTIAVVRPHERRQVP